MADKVADVLLARLRDWGVKQVFGYPSDGVRTAPVDPSADWAPESDRWRPSTSSTSTAPAAAGQVRLSPSCMSSPTSGSGR